MTLNAQRAGTYEPSIDEAQSRVSRRSVYVTAIAAGLAAIGVGVGSFLADLSHHAETVGPTQTQAASSP